MPVPKRAEESVRIDIAAEKVLQRRRRRYEKNRLAKGALPALAGALVVGWISQQGLPARGAPKELYVVVATVSPLLMLALLLDLRVFAAFEEVDATRPWIETALRALQPGLIMIAILAYLELRVARVLTSETRIEHEDPRVAVALLAAGVFLLVYTASLTAVRASRAAHAQARGSG